jgi:hypothetical protein
MIVVHVLSEPDAKDANPLAIPAGSIERVFRTGDQTPVLWIRETQWRSRFSHYIRETPEQVAAMCNGGDK